MATRVSNNLGNMRDNLIFDFLFIFSIESFFSARCNSRFKTSEDNVFDVS